MSILPFVLTSVGAFGAGTVFGAVTLTARIGPWHGQTPAAMAPATPITVVTIPAVDVSRPTDRPTELSEAIRTLRSGAALTAAQLHTLDRAYNAESARLRQGGAPIRSTDPLSVAFGESPAEQRIRELGGEQR